MATSELPDLRASTPPAPVDYRVLHIDKADHDRRAVDADSVRFGDPMIQISYDLAYRFLVSHVGERLLESGDLSTQS